MGLLLYVGNQNNILGFIPEISKTEAEHIMSTTPEKTYFLEDMCMPESKSGFMIRFNGTEFYYEKVEEPETVEPEPSQLDRIESVVNDIAKNNTSYAEMASAIAEGVNDIE